MKFSAAAVIATVAGAHAYAYGNGTAPVVSSSSVVEYTTEVVTKVTTYCPGPTEVTYGGETYTVTEVCAITRGKEGAVGIGLGGSSSGGVLNDGRRRRGDRGGTIAVGIGVSTSDGGENGGSGELHFD